MSLTMDQKRGLLWMLGIITVAALTNVAWHQIYIALTHCLSLF